MTTITLADRMKNYEKVETSRQFNQGALVYARIDGRSFSKFTKPLKSPFESELSYIMIETMKYLVQETHATLGYTQSDEISLAWVPDEGSQMLFNGKIFKLISALSALATVKFYSQCNDSPLDVLRTRANNMLPTFDARVCHVPTTAELSNMFLWRWLDAKKNSVQMTAHHHLGHKSIFGMHQDEQLSALSEIGIDYHALPTYFKEGTFAERILEERMLTDNELASIKPEYHPTGPVTRSRIKDMYLDATAIAGFFNK